MPCVYGKTQHSAADDIQKELDFHIKRSSSFKVAGVIYEFWNRSFPALSSQMKLFNQIGRFGGYMDIPVHYETFFISTIVSTLDSIH